MIVQNVKTNGGLGIFTVNYTETTAVIFHRMENQLLLVMETRIYISLR